MRSLIGTYLRLLCEMCGADTARIRIVVPQKDRPIVVFDRTVTAGPSPTRYPGDTESQMSLLEPFEGVVKASFPSESRETALPVTPNVAPWELIEPDGRGEWCFRGSLNGVCVELDVRARESAASFVNERMCRAAAFLPFLESLLGARSVPLPRLCRGELSAASFDPPLLGDTLAMVDLKRVVRKVSASDLSILIEGESGTGKEVIAQNVHRLSPRKGKPLVIANCLEMPHTLIQSELFGHAEGAFTGASRDRAGLIESANGGTFFLDEIGEMPLSLQAALLRVLQEREIRRIGESRRRTVDVRFVFATNRNLRELVRRGRFREDLYFRISAIRLYIPPLRQRRADIAMLAKHFLGGRPPRDPVPILSFGALRRLLAYQWPGNVRELRNEMERLRALHGGERMIAPEMLSPHIEDMNGEAMGVSEAEGDGLPGAVRALERRMITSALEHFSGNRTRAAAALGITRQGLLKKLKRYALSGGDARERENT
jgi:DNA-binding NtrC family response regulator